jgi:hypothetical protein
MSPGATGTADARSAGTIRRRRIFVSLRPRRLKLVSLLQGDSIEGHREMSFHYRIRVAPDGRRRRRPSAMTRGRSATTRRKLSRSCCVVEAASGSVEDGVGAGRCTSISRRRGRIPRHQLGAPDASIEVGHSLAQGV